MESIKIPVINKSGNKLPVYAKEGDSGIDLMSNLDGVVEPNSTKMFPIDIHVAIPQGHEIQIRSRSGLATVRLRNSVG